MVLALASRRQARTIFWINEPLDARQKVAPRRPDTSTSRTKGLAT